MKKEEREERRKKIRQHLRVACGTECPLAAASTTSPGTQAGRQAATRSIITLLREARVPQESCCASLRESWLYKRVAGDPFQGVDDTSSCFQSWCCYRLISRFTDMLWYIILYHRVKMFVFVSLESLVIRHFPLKKILFVRKKFSVK